MSTKNIHSGTWLPTNVVIKLAEGTIKHIEEERAKRKADAIEKNRRGERKRFYFFGRILPRETDTEVEQRMKGGDTMGALSWQTESGSIYAWKSLEVAEHILAEARAAANHTDKFFITAEDFRHIRE